MNAAARTALIRYFVMALILFAILRLASGRAAWTRAWLYVGLTLGAQLTVGLLIARKNPDLLAERSRMQPGTKTWDRWLAPAVAILGPLATTLTAALDMRFNWPPRVPAVWSAGAFAVIAAGILFTAWAMLSNRFFAATVRIQHDRGHTVIDNGPYRIVRHPGYTGALAFSIASPVALGSWLALIPAALLAAALVLRTALEDHTLRAARVTNRLVPAIW
jgi:protein-S-isoprenylcysteine O-methyltransferase Ste14